MCKLGLLLSLEYGEALPAEVRAGHGFPVFGSNGEVGRHQSSLIPGPGIIVGRKGSVGKVTWSDEPFWPIDTTYWVDSPPEDRRWLYWVLSWLPLHLLDTSTGVPGLNRNDVYELMVYQPEACERHRIAQILDTLDTAIRETEAINGKLKAVKQGLLHDLLARGIDANGELRPPQSEAPQLYKESPLGWVPKEWEILSLGSCAEITSGVTLGRSLSGFGVIELPYLRVANVQDGYLDLREIKTVPILPTELPRFALKAGDVLMNEGGDFDKLGRGAVWEGQIEPCLHQNHVFRVRCDNSRLLPRFLAAYSGSVRGKSYFVQASKQTTNLASINSTQLKAFEITCPPLFEQEVIIKDLSDLDGKVNTEQYNLEKLRSLKLGLMDDLLTGRVRVTPLLQGAATP